MQQACTPSGGCIECRTMMDVSACVNSEKWLWKGTSIYQTLFSPLAAEHDPSAAKICGRRKKYVCKKENGIQGRPNINYQKAYYFGSSIFWRKKKVQLCNNYFFLRLNSATTTIVSLNAMRRCLWTGRAAKAASKQILLFHLWSGLRMDATSAQSAKHSRLGTPVYFCGPFRFILLGWQ